MSDQPWVPPSAPGTPPPPPAQWEPPQPSATKRCPRCGQAVPVAAMACGHCGYDPRRLTPYGQVTTVNGLAIASMILGILWLYWIGSVLALIFGVMAKKQIDRSHGLQTGRGMAITGIVLGCIGVGLLLVVVLAIIITVISGATRG